MKKLGMTLVAVITLISSASFADTIHVSVNGLVCAFCATGIEKTFKKLSAVKNVNVDLANKLVTISTKPNEKIDDSKVTELINDAGYSVTRIDRGK